MEFIQVYAKSVFTEASSGDDVMVTVNDFDGSQVLAQFSVKDRLDSIDKGDILDYLHQLELDEE